NRIALLWELARFRRTRTAALNMPLFKVSLPPVPHLQPPDPMDMLRREYEVLGFICATHPVILFRNRVPSRITSMQLPQMSGRHICFLGWLLTGKLVSTKTGEAMEFLTFEDEFGLVEATFFPRIYRRYAHLLASGKPYVLHGLVETDHGAATLTVDRVAALEKV
ncbi:MAG TPA: OB-fold nucleic acid binding domain-containing protein, partial [Desulfopila sp.]|nr:OB-fold nucleic acid binding domain-containing protein [Desulfopila sp.]